MFDYKFGFAVNGAKDGMRIKHESRNLVVRSQVKCMHVLKIASQEFRVNRILFPYPDVLSLPRP
jgi:hypothetical protein